MKPQRSWGVPAEWRPWLRKPWVRLIVVVIGFGVLGLSFMLAEERKDSGYWAGYADAQRWVDDNAYAARDESIGDFCAQQASHHDNAHTYQRGCLDGAHNAMRSAH